MREKGFICGVCHPKEDYDQIKNANIDWVRMDIPFPFDENGEICSRYLLLKNALIPMWKKDFR